MKVTAAVTHEKGQLSIEEVDLAPPGPSQVLVRTVACGVCHTDGAGIRQLIPVALPAIFGHEGAGVVEDVGPGVGSLKKGDRVIMTFPSCGACAYCAGGHPYACDHLNALFFEGTYRDGTKRFSQNGKAVSSFFGQGSFATHVVVDARNAVRADVDSDEELAKLCSLGCGVQTGAGAVLNRLKPEPGTSLAVFGCGGVGMSAIMAGAIAGCGTIIGVDVIPSRLETARAVGATHVVNGNERDAVEEIKRLTGGGAHGSVESSGIPALTLQALACLRRLGTAVVVSVTGEEKISLPLEPYLMNPSVTLAGLTEGGSDPQRFLPELVRYFKEGRLPVDKLVTFYDFKDVEQAFRDARSGAAIKPVLRF
ncbi:MAG: NAD(P)-dependent alcohol dehydrogenase [Clostridiales Family XIII bacterium]|jgi:aryl-alcohol dehydrogenase|nr:NAD(P)-dependent alcohol dehydrogenase [Clostridiales Family XIII bacterium]